MNIYSSGKQGNISFDGNGVYHAIRKEQLRIQLFCWDFPIPFTTRFIPERWLVKVRADGGYSMELIAPVLEPNKQ